MAGAIQTPGPWVGQDACFAGRVASCGFKPDCGYDWLEIRPNRCAELSAADLPQQGHSPEEYSQLTFGLNGANMPAGLLCHSET